MRKRYLTAFFATAMLFAQAERRPQEAADLEPVRLPNGTLQSDAILKAEHDGSLKDAAQLQRLSTELSIELEKNDRHVVSMQTLKKLDEMEKLVKRIRGRMKRM